MTKLVLKQLDFGSEQGAGTRESAAYKIVREHFKRACNDALGQNMSVLK
jgi:hypothetical protein